MSPDASDDAEGGKRSSIDERAQLMAQEMTQFCLAIREVLLADWDPHNAARMPEASGTYDTYVRPLADLIRSGADEQAIVEWLHEREKESMCFPSLGTQRLRRVARKLLALPAAD